MTQMSHASFMNPSLGPIKNTSTLRWKVSENIEAEEGWAGGGSRGLDTMKILSANAEILQLSYCIFGVYSLKYAIDHSIEISCEEINGLEC